MVYYESLQSAYGWTVAEIDAMDAAFLLEQLAAKMKAETKAAFIEDILL